MAQRWIVGDTPLDSRTLVGLADDRPLLTLGDAARARLAAGRAIVERYAAGSEPVYGLNTGLGGNIGHRLDPREMEDFQVRVIRGRSIGVGESLPESVCRAVLIARIAGLAQGVAGVSPAVVEHLVALANAGLAPAIPCRGAIGAGDLGLMAPIGALALGLGEAWHQGGIRPAGEALREAGLTPVRLGPKDGLGLINASTVSAAFGAFVLARVEHWLLVGAAAAALASEGYAANPSIHDPRIAALRPASGQALAAALMRAFLAGSSLHDPGAARSIQDALSFRTVAPVLGMALTALSRARQEIDIELAGAADNPAVLIDDAHMLSTPNFHTPAIAHAFDSLAIAVPPVATAHAYRCFKLMNPVLSGLPKYLSPVGGSSTGYNSLQKTIAALHGEVRLRATPASLDTLPVSDSVEDHAPQTMLAITKVHEQCEALSLLVAIEAMVAAQAADLRQGRLGAGSRILHAAVRDVVPPLEEDRETGPDAVAVRQALASPRLGLALGTLAPEAFGDLSCQKTVHS